MDALTICAANYLPFAEVLGKSFLENNQASNFTILVVDGLKTEFKKNSQFSYLLPVDLDIDKNIFNNMAFYYDVTELSTALKPSALKKLFSMGKEKIVYLDPDIKVFGQFTELEQFLDGKSIVLTPHTIHPIPRDGLRPSESDIMASGAYNLGFIALSKSKTSIEFLDWWEERLRFDSISDPEEMLFTDQRWIDLAPSYFPIDFFRNPGFNVAYWNLHERSLSKTEDEYFAGDKPLVFFHFSGYSPDKPWILSKYVSDNPRVVISKDRILAELCEQYGMEATRNGWDSTKSLFYGYSNFENGKPIPSSVRRLYREDCIKAFQQNEILKPPPNLQEWATSRTSQTGNLSRILFSLWRSRPDLKRRFPDATGTEAKDLLYWASTHGIQERVIDESFLSIGNLEGDDFPTKFSRKEGINVSGYLKGELGLGQSARLILNAAKHIGVPVTTLNSNRSTSRALEKVEINNSSVIYPYTIAIVNADHFQFWINDVGQDIANKTRVVGVWAWETEDFPESMHSAFDLVDEIWAVSEFVKGALINHTKKPIYVYPNQIESPRVTEKLDRNAIGIEDHTKYNLFIFDYASVFNRKNPLGLVQAHIEAFPNQDGPVLIIKSTNGNKDAENREKLRFSIKNRDDILLIEHYLTRDQLTSLLNECEAYISLHRSEGYGLTMAEAMSLGKPVIATGYSGNLDFMNQENSFLVPYTLEKIGDESFPYLPDSKWAEPDLVKAAELLKLIWIESDLAKKKGLIAMKSTTEIFTLRRSSEFILYRLTNQKLWLVKFKKGAFAFKRILKKYFKLLFSIIKKFVN